MDTRLAKETSNSIVPFPNCQPRNGPRAQSPDRGAHSVRNAVISATQVALDEGVSGTTIWRRVKAGWLTQVNIAGRAYITVDSLERFYDRARRGEFAKAPHGALAKKVA